MALKRIQCRSHQGGIFAIHPKRGRQPVSCKPEYPCDRADTGETTAEYVPADQKPALDRARALIARGEERAERAATAMLPSNPSLPLAKAAKERLTAVGWVCEGKAGLDEHYWATLTCSRGTETLVMQWIDTELTAQDYSMEFEKPSDNGYPENDLHFNPDELTDSELVRMIQGMRVTWWNTIGQSRESAIVGSNVTVAHVYRDGREDDTKRMVTFISKESGFRTFHVSALLKVG